MFVSRGGTTSFADFFGALDEEKSQSTIRQKEAAEAELISPNNGA
jgi:hypothetical protein